MNEAQTRTDHIDPALRAAGWGVVEGEPTLAEQRISVRRLSESTQPDRQGVPTDLDALKASLLHHALTGQYSANVGNEVRA